MTTHTDPLKLAIAFHDTYERLAPSFGYVTRPDTRSFAPDSPNGKLMIAVCAEILASTSPPAVAEVNMQESERERFEKEMRAAGNDSLALSVYALPDQLQPAYSDPITKARWEGWQARSALSQPQDRQDAWITPQVERHLDSQYQAGQKSGFNAAMEENAKQVRFSLAGAKMPDGSVVCNVYEAFEAGKLSALSQPPAPVDERISKLDAENKELHRRLAAAELDAKTAWSRYENANSSRLTTERRLEQANSSISKPPAVTDQNMQATEPHDCSGIEKLRERLAKCDRDRPMLVHPLILDGLFGSLDGLRQVLDAERQPPANPCPLCDGHGTTPVWVKEPPAVQVPEEFDGETHIDMLAMALAAEEHSDIHQLIYEGYPPEPWGEVWQRYIGEAKSMIHKVNDAAKTAGALEAANASPSPAAAERVEEVPEWISGTVVGGDAEHNTVTVRIDGAVPRGLWMMGAKATIAAAPSASQKTEGGE